MTEYLGDLDITCCELEAFEHEILSEAAETEFGPGFRRVLEHEPNADINQYLGMAGDSFGDREDFF